MHATVANLCFARYKQIETSHQNLAINYRALILATAEQYLTAIPPIDTLLKPDGLAQVIELMLHGYDMTGEKKYFNRADFFGQISIKQFLDDGLPLPKTTNRSQHYEAITGGPHLMYALLQIAH